jgi:hypothetical protein
MWPGVIAAGELGANWSDVLGVWRLAGNLCMWSLQKSSLESTVHAVDLISVLYDGTQQPVQTRVFAVR